MRPSAEEVARLKADREVKKAAKRNKYGNQNIPTVEVRIPWEWDNGLPIDLGRHSDWVDALEGNWRVADAIRRDAYPHDIYRGPVKIKIIRT